VTELEIPLKLVDVRVVTVSPRFMGKHADKHAVTAASAARSDSSDPIAPRVAKCVRKNPVFIHL